VLAELVCIVIRGIGQELDLQRAPERQGVLPALHIERPLEFQHVPHRPEQERGALRHRRMLRDLGEIMRF
jgi:hypothetical protein